MLLRHWLVIPIKINNQLYSGLYNVFNILTIDCKEWNKRRVAKNCGVSNTFSKTNFIVG